MRCPDGVLLYIPLNVLIGVTEARRRLGTSIFISARRDLCDTD